MPIIAKMGMNRGYQHWITSYSFKRKNPLKVLAKLSSHNLLDCEEACFLYFRLGMYKSVINHPYEGNGWRGNFAKAVSYAAIGELELALIKIHHLRNYLKISVGIHRRLATELAPYLPEISLQIIDEVAPNTIFHLALLIHLNKLDQAYQLLDVLDTKDIQIAFYRMNLLQSSLERLENLNLIFQYYYLEPVSLVNSSRQLSANNIKCDVEECQFSGPLVSILMTAYNSGEFLHTALESLLNQSYRNIEIVVIDDASNDNTVEIIQYYAQGDARVKVVLLSENVGTFVAKTEGLKVAEGEFITCHDSDDWAHPRKIEMQIVPLLEDQQLIFTTSQWIRMQEGGCLYARKIFPLLRLNPASPMFRRDVVLEKVGYWDQVRTGADSEFLERLKIVFGDKAIHQVKKPLTIGAHRAGSLMTNSITGYSSFTGLSQRVEYWESWKNRHFNEIKRPTV